VAAIIFATINVVGGFMVTDRMLEMFKKKGDDK
jgi:NAD(P) transhydrogenase subunit alpha